MEPKEIDKTLFEQHWIHSRHIESERMWIMGIWLGVTAVMFKETWFSAQSGLTLTALRTMGWAHLILTGAVLVIILKLQLAYDVHNSRIKEISRGASRRHLWWSGCRTWVPPNGAVYSTIFCAAIFPDINLLTSQCLQSRLPNVSEHLAGGASGLGDRVLHFWHLSVRALVFPPETIFSSENTV